MHSDSLIGDQSFDFLTDLDQIHSVGNNDLMVGKFPSLNPFSFSPRESDIFDKDAEWDLYDLNEHLTDITLDGMSSSSSDSILCRSNHRYS